jgi:hypothetical protein
MRSDDVHDLAELLLFSLKLIAGGWIGVGCPRQPPIAHPYYF